MTIHTQLKHAEPYTLLDAIRNNDVQTLEKLYQTNYPKVAKYIKNNSGTDAQAKDIFQEAMIALWRAVKTKKFTATTEDALQAYLYTISKNKWIDYLRSSRNKKEISSEIAMTNYTLSDEVIEDTDYEIKLQKAQKAFKQLGASCKELLSKFYFEKMSLKEIASLLDLDAASTRNKKYRCMQQLRRLALPQNKEK